jgi:hypothetical protein
LKTGRFFEFSAIQFEVATQATVRFLTTSVITVCHSLKIQGHRRLN